MPFQITRETRFIKGKSPVFDFNIEGYSHLETPTESSAGSLLYISNQYAFHPRKDLDFCMYQAKNLESVFAEIVLPKKTNIIVGSIYWHPSMPIDLFNHQFLIPFLHKVSSENKQILLLGDFNINLLNPSDDSGVSSFVDILGSHLILPEILLPTRITNHCKTLIDNIFSTLIGISNVSGNLIQSISDHLPQFCVFPARLNDHAKDECQFQNWSKFNQTKRRLS